MIETDSSPIDVYTVYMNRATKQTIVLRQWVKSKFAPHYNTEHLEVDNYIKDEHGNSINWLGCTTPIMGLDGKWLFIIQINSYTLDPFSSNVKQATITHEIGHLLWLEDFFKINDKGESNPVPYGEYSLMDYGRDMDIIYIPQAMDVYHVNKQFTTD